MISGRGVDGASLPQDVGVGQRDGDHPTVLGVLEVERGYRDFGSRAVPPFSPRFDAKDRGAWPNVIGDGCGGRIAHLM